MRGAALPRYHQLAEMPVEEGGKQSKGLQNTHGAGDSLRGFPQQGQFSPTLPTLSLRPRAARDVGITLSPALPVSDSSCSPKPSLGSADFPPFPFRCCFLITSNFCQELCKHFPENSKGRAKSGGTRMCFPELPFP